MIKFYPKLVSTLCLALQDPHSAHIPAVPAGIWSTISFFIVGPRRTFAAWRFRRRRKSAPCPPEPGRPRAAVDRAAPPPQDLNCLPPGGLRRDVSRLGPPAAAVPVTAGRGGPDRQGSCRPRTATRAKAHAQLTGTAMYCNANDAEEKYGSLGVRGPPYGP